jgi:hypothetical protein
MTDKRRSPRRLALAQVPGHRAQPPPHSLLLATARERGQAGVDRRRASWSEDGAYPAEATWHGRQIGSFPGLAGAQKSWVIRKVKTAAT